MRKGIASALLASALLTGCSSGNTSDKPGVTTPVSTPPGGKEYSGKEVDITGCSQGAVSVITPRPVVADQAHGKLELRKARPAICTHIYWARFRPDPSNKAPFEITITVGDKTFKPQASEKDVPTMEAWTVGAYAEVGSLIKVCLQSEGVSNCLEEYEVTS